MAWILLESLVALLVLLFIVWWTMRPSWRRTSSRSTATPDPDDRKP